MLCALLYAIIRRGLRLDVILLGYRSRGARPAPQARRATPADQSPQAASEGQAVPRGDEQDAAPGALGCVHRDPGHARGIVACDFFTVETVFLKTLYVLVFMHIETRRILGVGVSANPNRTWVTQQARNLAMDLDEDPEPCVRFLLRDRDAKFCRSFDAVFAAECTEVVLTPYRTHRPTATSSG